MTDLPVGRRVVVRHRTPDGAATDVLGVLVAADHERLVIRPDRTPGDADVTVARPDVIAAKPVPARARRASDVDALERIMAEHWRSPDTARLGGDRGWLLRAAQGFTNRANSALVTGDPGVPLREALDEVVGWYRSRGLGPRLAVPDWPSRRWDGVRDAGWTALPGAGAHVQVASVPDLLRRAGLGSADLPRVRWTAVPDDAWLAAYHYRGQDLPPIGLSLLCSAHDQGFGSVQGEDGDTIAVIRVSSGAGWAGITAVEVDPAHRRRGLGRGLVTAAADWAAQRSLDRCYLQVGTGNEPALRLYLDAGFIEHHTYEYVVPPTPR